MWFHPFNDQRHYIGQWPGHRELQNVFKELWSIERSFVGVLQHTDAHCLAKSLPPGYYFVTYESSNDQMAIYLRHNSNKNNYTIRYCTPTTQAYKHRLPAGFQPLDRSKCILWRGRVNDLARASIDTWSLCAQQLNVIRDVRRLIAQLVWQERHVWCP